MKFINVKTKEFKIFKDSELQYAPYSHRIDSGMSCALIEVKLDAGPTITVCQQNLEYVK